MRRCALDVSQLMKSQSAIEKSWKNEKRYDEQNAMICYFENRILDIWLLLMGLCFESSVMSYCFATVYARDLLDPEVR